MDVVTLGAALSIMKKMPDTAASSAAAAEDAKTAAEEAQAAAEAAAEQAEGAIEVDDTLSVRGRAADAKAVGDVKDGLIDLKSAFDAIATTGGMSAQMVDPTKYVAGYKWNNAYNTDIDDEPVLDSGWTIVDQKWLIGDDKVLGFNYNSPNIQVLGYRYRTQYGDYLREATYSGSNFVADGTHYKLELGSNISAIRVYATSSWLNGLSTPLIMAINSDWDGNPNYGQVSGAKINSNVEIPQINVLKNEVESDIQDLQKLNLGTLEDGYINSAYGSAMDATSYKRTGFIHVQADKLKVAITFSVASVGFAFYDSRKKYISGFDYTGYNVGDLKEVDVPDNACYFRYCAVNANVSLMQVLIPNYANAISRINTNPCFYDLSSECRTFKKILCIGDSLTAGQFDYKENGTIKEFNDPDYSYPAFLKALTGRDITNAGDAGETTVSWYELHGQEDFSGHDACIIMLGRNDYVSGRETTSEERATAFANIIAKVRADNPQITIFVATLINYYTGSGADSMNADIRAAATANNCYLLDIAAYGRMVLSDDAYSHCTAEGYYTLAEYFFRYISYIMHNNYTAFKTIQFTGTNRAF